MPVLEQFVRTDLNSVHSSHGNLKLEESREIWYGFEEKSAE